ncbi:MAG: hypothetical protein CL489_08470 [Acidobacteria bacterium]|nr:hypothetical protein [Acidobacteriota bacterium]|tara:strand:- start:51425 stop:51751 length:327 start_codon:yes stop_codon:yes gene_type:complete
MKGYLGTEVVSHEEAGFKDYTPFDWVMYFIECYGQFDGSHHKDWVMDQVARIYNGTPIIVEKASWDNGHYEYRVHLDKPTEKYHKWVRDMKDGEDGANTYSYDEGIAP